MGLKAEGDQNLQIVFLFDPGACFLDPEKWGYSLTQESILVNSPLC